MLYIIANTGFFLTHFVMQGLHESPAPTAEDAPRVPVRVLSHDSRRRGLAKSLAKFVEASVPWDAGRTGSRYFDAAYLEQLRAITPQDSVLIFGVENIKELRILSRHLRTRHITLFTWNPVRDYQQNVWLRQLHLRALKGLGMRVVTFDPSDAQHYDLPLVDQVYRDVSAWLAPPCTAPEVEIDLYFVGQDKGRLALLCALREAATRAGLRCYFHITADKSRRYSPQQRALLADAPLSYADNLAWIACSRCLVEVPQSHQSGATVRSLEAAFFGKKLLTTRPSALHDTLYSADRVKVWEAVDSSAAESAAESECLAAFVTSAHHPIAAALLQRHDIGHWCQQFVAAAPAPRTDRPDFVAPAEAGQG